MNAQELKAMARNVLELDDPVALPQIVQRWPDLVNLSDIVALALVDPVAHKAARAVAADYIKRGDVLPDDLRKFTCNYLTEISPRPKGRSKMTNMLRDRLIALAVNVVHEAGGLDIHQNPGTDRKTLTACDLVGDVAHLSPETIRDIYYANQ